MAIEDVADDTLASPPVFVDPTGRRSRRIAWAGRISTLLFAGFLVLLGAGAARAPWVPSLHLPNGGALVPRSTQTPPSLPNAVASPLPTEPPARSGGATTVPPTTVANPAATTSTVRRAVTATTVGSGTTTAPATPPTTSAAATTTTARVPGRSSAPGQTTLPPSASTTSTTARSATTKPHRP